MKRAWSVLLPSCVATLARQDSFGLVPKVIAHPINSMIYYVYGGINN